MNREAVRAVVCESENRTYRYAFEIFAWKLDRGRPVSTARGKCEGYFRRISGKQIRFRAEWVGLIESKICVFEC